MKYRIIQHRTGNKVTHFSVETYNKHFILFGKWVQSGGEFKCLADARYYVQTVFENRSIVEERELL